MDTQNTYIHREKPSILSQYLPRMFKLLGGKKYIEKKILKKEFGESPAPVPKSIATGRNIRVTTIHNRKVWTIKSSKDPSDKLILYLHGGAYIFNLKKFDWEFAESLTSQTNATVILPDYPLSPEYTCASLYAFMDELYKWIVTEHPSKKIILMGLSAGAGLALGYSMRIRDLGGRQPEQIILLSPWLDVTMSNHDILEIDRKDRILGINGLQMAGELYAGDLDLKNYRVSPIYGNLSDLGEVSLFTGTHDILLADARKMKLQFESLGIPINYFEYPKMFHGWMEFKELKESIVALEQIAGLINDGYRNI
jgi:acetyl esterase/lipase